MKVIETDGSYSVERTDFEQKVGIQPVDFYKVNRTGCSNDVEALHALDPSLCSYNLPPDHITNLCSDEELQSLCFQRPGTLEYIRDEASAALGVLPDEMVEAWQTLFIAKQNGRQEFRHVCREAAKEAKRVLGAA
jgi:hypothetical protein